MHRYGSWTNRVTHTATRPEVAFHGRLFASDRSAVPNIEQARQVEAVALVEQAWWARGPQGVTDLDGEFAAVVATEREWVGVVDPLGRGALYYSWQAGTLYWAFELKELVQLLPSVTRNEDTLYRFLVEDLFMQPVSPHGETVYREIHQVQPGTFVRVHEGELTVTRYWSWETAVYADLTYAEAVSEFDRLFTRAVQKRIAGHDQVGLLLSGGLDSNAVALVATDLLGPERISAVSFLYPTVPELDESTRIAHIASHLRLRWQAVEADRNNLFADWLTQYPQLPCVTSTGSVSAHREAAATMQATGATLMLTGGGSDSAFSVPTYAPVRLLRDKRWQQWWRWWGEVRRYRERPRGFLWRDVLRPAYFQPEQSYAMTELADVERPDWLVPRNAHQASLGVDWEPLLTERRFLPEREALPDLDVLYGTAGLAVSHPFLDRDLVLFVNNIAPWYKRGADVAGGPLTPKRLLRTWLQGKLPADLVERHAQKVSSAAWLRNHLHAARHLLRTELPDNARLFQTGLVERQALDRELDRLLQGAYRSQRTLSTYTRAIMLEGWLRTTDGEGGDTT